MTIAVFAVLFWCHDQAIQLSTSLITWARRYTPNPALLNCTLAVMKRVGERFPTDTARKALALRLHLPYHDTMQDWEWEVADVARFEEFLAAYCSSDVTEDEQFSLMEILLQCVEEMPDEERASGSWQAIEPHLKANMNLHRSTIQYWACLGEEEPSACFRVAPNMRQLQAWSATSNMFPSGTSWRRPTSP